MEDLLLRDAADGDEDAWAELVRTHSPIIWSVIRRYRIPQDAATDVYQTVWLIAVEKIGTIRDSRCTGSWLATTAKRTCLSLIRRTDRVRYDDTLADRADEGESPEDQCLSQLRDQAVRRAIRSLSERDRRLLAVVMAEPRPDYRQIARTLGMPVGSIGPTRARALRRLRSEFARLGVDSYAQIG